MSKMFKKLVILHNYSVYKKHKFLFDCTVTGGSMQQDVILPTVLGAVGLVCFSLVLVAFMVIRKRKQAPQPE